ncbi:prolipoprotein diacylglyceryl transferase [Patescibacteria group bacterium]|nr:prolipoprotein diacylglyceryl transferase [Patescibacteria group bacterium]
MLKEIITFSLFGQQVTLYYYGFFLLLAVLAGVLILYRELKKRQLETKRILDNILWILLCGVLGGRLAYVLFHCGYYLDNLSEIYQYWYGGFYFGGAFLGAFIYVFAWLYLKKRQELLSWLDASIEAIFVSYAVASLGSYIAGVQSGKMFAESLSKHPFELYQAIAYVTLFFLATASYRYVKNLQPGDIFFAGMILSGITQFVLAFALDDSLIFRIGSLIFNPVHILALLVLTVGVIGLIMKRRNT